MYAYIVHIYNTYTCHMYKKKKNRKDKKQTKQNKKTPEISPHPIPWIQTPKVAKYQYRNFAGLLKKRVKAQSHNRSSHAHKQWTALNIQCPKMSKLRNEWKESEGASIE